jgi:hypothetical protein
VASAQGLQPHCHLLAKCLEHVGASKSNNQPYGPPRAVTRITLPFNFSLILLVLHYTAWLNVYNYKQVLVNTTFKVLHFLHSENG